MTEITETPDSKTVFKDAEFVKNNANVSDQWVSIRELYPDGIKQPLLPETFSRDQFAQGKHYECFMLSTLATLVRFPDVIRRCFVTKNARHDGRYTFRFFRGDQWVKVEIDDSIPLEDDEVLYCQSPTEHWWPLLLEKAYAKFYTTYEYLEGCTLLEAFHDLTGYPVLNIPMQAKLAKTAGVNIDDGPYWLKVGEQLRHGEFVAACLTKDTPDLESIGMQSEQQYGILDIFSLTGSSAISDLVLHIHNPFDDDEFEYTGPLNKNDKTWTAKQRVQYDVDNRHSIFIPLPNFKKLVVSIQLCFMASVNEKATYFEDEWKGESAGGNPTFITWRKNPLYLVRNTGSKDVRIIVTIKQKDQRAFTSPEDSTTYVQCGLILSRSNASNAIPTFWVTGNNNKPAYKSLFLNSREVANVVTIPAQSLSYLVPSTMSRGTEASFLLAINYFTNEDYSPVSIEKLKIPGMDWVHPATTNTTLEEHSKDRVDFYVDCETDVHILLHQTQPPAKAGGDTMTESYMGMYLYDDTDRRVNGVHAATNFREISVIHHVARSGRYAVSLTCPRSKVAVPCLITIVGSPESNVRIVDPPEDAEMFDDEDVIDEGGDEEVINPIDWVPINLPGSEVAEIPDSHNPFEDKKFFVMNRGASNEAWMHIGDLYPDGKNKPLLPDVLSRDQFEQGENFECCCLTGFAALVDHHPDVIRNCFISKNPRKDGRYTFQFHRYGQWLKVEIDDRIPVIEGRTAYCRSPTCSWWPLLLEKAYAKFYTLYQNLEGCTQQEVFHDFTGRPIITISTNPALAKAAKWYVEDGQFWHALKKSVSTCVLTANVSSNETAEEYGLLEDQYYAILDVVPTSSDESCELSSVYIKMFNPFLDSPYTGPMNQNDGNWNPSLRHEMGADEKNVFVMPADVFLQTFSALQQGYVGGPLEPGWHFNSEWSDETNGGNPMLISWRENPLYVVKSTSKEPFTLVTMVREPDQRHMLHQLQDSTLEYPRKGITLAQAVPHSSQYPTYLVTMDNHKLVHKGVFQRSREVCDLVTIPANSLNYLVGSCLQNEKTKFILSYWFLSKDDATNVNIKRYQEDVSRKQPAVAAVMLKNRGKERVDFLVDTPTNIHILLQQEKPRAANHNGDVVTDDFCAIYLFDSNDKLVKGVPAAMSFREISIVDHLPTKGRYALSITCPRGSDSVPCKVEIVGVEESHVRITDTPENAKDLNAVDLGFMDQSPFGVPLAELPLESDRIFQEKLEALRKLLQDPNADPDEIQRLKNELNARARELAAALIGADRPVYLPGRDLETLNPLLDADDAYMAAEFARYELKQDPRSHYKLAAQEEKLRGMADSIAEDFANKKLDFIDQEPEGIPIEDLPLHSDEQFTNLLKQRALLMKHPADNAAAIAKLEGQLNDRAHEIARGMHDKERFYLDPTPEGIPLSMLPLNDDDAFREMENRLRALNGMENPDGEAIDQLQEALNARAHEMAADLKARERQLFLPSQVDGVSLDSLNLDDDKQFHEKELRRLALRLEDPAKNEDEIRELEKTLNARASQLATDQQERERDFLASEDVNPELLRHILNKDPDFLAKEARLRELMKDPRGNAAAIAALKQEMLEDAKRLLQKYKEEQRPSYLKKEYDGRPTKALPLTNDPEFDNLENKYLTLCLNPSEADPKELEALKESLNERAGTIAHNMNVKDRAGYLGPKVRGMALAAIPLDEDEKFRAQEQERARSLYDASKQPNVPTLEASLQERASELVKSILAKDRAYLHPTPAGVPVELVPLDDDPQFQQLESERGDIKRNGLATALNVKEKELNDRAAEIAQSLKEKERDLFLEKEYNNVPTQSLPLDTDAAFKEAEIARLRLKQEDAHKNGKEITALEKKMSDRAAVLATQQKLTDRAFLSGYNLPISADLLNTLLDRDEEFLKMQERLRQLKKDPVANANAIKELEAAMAKRAQKVVDDYLAAERAKYLKAAYEGRPTKTLPLDEDSVFKKLENEYLTLAQDPKANQAKLAELRAALDARAAELAHDMNVKDQKKYLPERIRGIPIGALALDDDDKFNALQAARAAALSDPSKADEVAKLEEALRQRADELAKAKLAADRAFLDQEPEGIPIECVGLDEDRDFKSKEEQRAALVSENEPTKNGKAISALQESMNAQAHTTAKKLKQQQIEECVDPQIRGVARDVLALAEDPQCTKLIAQRAKALQTGDSAAAQKLAGDINKRAHDVTDQLIDKVRSNLKPDPLKVPLNDLDLDKDSQFKEMENEAIGYLKDPQKNADKLSDLYEEMDRRAAQLAEDKVWTEREAYMAAAPEGRALRDLPLNSDDAFLNLEKQRRDLLRGGNADPARVADLEKKLNARASEIAQNANAGDRESYLGKAIRGIPVGALALDDDDEFRELERQRAANKRSRGISNDAVEESLRSRAAALADKKLKSDRAYLDPRPEGVALRQVPLDSDKTFKQLEEKRADLKNAGGASAKDLADVEAKMNKRAHELAAAVKETGRSLLNQKPLGVPLADLHLDDDAPFNELEERYRDAVEAGDTSAADDSIAKLNDRAVQLAATLHEKERSNLNATPRGIPLSELPVNDDPTFNRLENEARALRTKQPTSSRLNDLKDQLNARATEMANEARAEYLDAAPGGIPLTMLHFENEPAFLKAEEHRRAALKSDPAKVPELNKQLNSMAQQVADKCITGDRDYLDAKPEGVPRDILPMDTDKHFHDAELERAKLVSQDPKQNAAKIKAYETKLNERLHELALAQKKTDLEGLDAAPRGIPLENLKPHEDATFAGMVDKVRALKKDPQSNRDAIKTLQGQMNERAHQMANDRILSDRDFLDKDPEGVPLSVLNLDKDPKFVDLEAQRANLKSVDPRRNAAAVKELENQLNKRAHDMAKEQKDRELGLLNQNPRDIPLESLKPFEDSEFQGLVDQQRALGSVAASDPKAQALVDAMNKRTDKMAADMLEGDRDYLLKNPKGVPLSILPLDADPVFHKTEVKRAVLKAENARRNADKIKELEDQLNVRALELAEAQRQKDLEGVDPKPNGVPLSVLDPHQDPTFSKMVEKRRKLEEKPQANAAELNQLVASMNDRALELAKGMVENDRGYLDKDPEGVPLEVLPLNSDATFKAMESQRAVLKAQDPRKNAKEIKELEGKLNDRAHELAKSQKEEDLNGVNRAPLGVPVELLKPHDDPTFAEMVKSVRALKNNNENVDDQVSQMNDHLEGMARKVMDRDFVDPEPDGVALKDLPLDTDDQFKQMEAERAVLKLKDPRRNADKIKALERDLNTRAHDLAKEQKKEDLSGVDAAPGGVPKENLNLHDDAKSRDIILQLRSLKKEDAVANAGRIADLNRQLNDRAHEVAGQLMDGDRTSYLDAKPLGIPLAHLPLNTDPTFHDLEVERAKLKAADPRGNAHAIKSTEGLLNDRSRVLARAVMDDDLKPFKAEYEGIPTKELNPHKDKVFAQAAYQRRQNKMEPTALVDDEELEQVMSNRLIAMANEQKKGDLYFLDPNPEGVPLDDVPYLSDSGFLQMKAQREKLKTGDAFENRGEIAKLEDMMNARVAELARGVLDDDFARVNKKPRDIPLELLKPREDPDIQNLVTELRRTKKTPSLKNRVAELEQQIDDRVDALALHQLEDGRENYLDSEPEGVPLSFLPLNTDPAYHSLDAQRAILKIENPTKNSSQIQDLETKLNDRAHDLALAQKDEDLQGVDKTPLGVPLAILKPHSDPKMMGLINEARVLKKDPVRHADKIRSHQAAMSDRAYEMAREVLEGDRSYLGSEVHGVPVSELPLDTDETFHNLEVQRAKEKAKDPKSRAVADLEDELRAQAEVLAKEQKSNDLLGLNPAPLGVPLSLLRLHQDDKFAAQVPELRRLNKDPSRNAAKLKTLRDKLNDRALELADGYVEADRERYLDAEPEGIPRHLLPLSDCAEFKSLEESKFAMQAEDPKGNKEKIREVEGDLNLVAHNVALAQLKKDRSYLDQQPEGVPVGILPLDTDKTFHELEAKRAAAKAKNPTSQEINELEEKLNERAHELAKEQIKQDLDGLNQRPRDIPVEVLRPHNDPVFAQMVDDIRPLKADSSAASASAVRDLQDKMNERLDQLADTAMSNDRSYLPSKPEGIPIARLPLDSDPEFHEKEVQRARLKLDDPQKNQSKITALESELVQRAKELAKEVKASDFNGLNPTPRGLPIELLNMHKDAKCATLLEEKGNLPKTRAIDASNPIIQSLNAQADQMADAMLKGDRDYLDREPEGVPLADLPLDTDTEFHNMEVERAVLKAKDPVKNASTISGLEDQLNSRLHSLACEALANDRSYLDPKPEGVPLEVLPLDTDARFHQMEVERARLQRKGGQQGRVVELEEKLNERAKELAKKQLDEDLQGLDREPEGYPLAFLNLHADADFAGTVPSLRAAKAKRDTPTIRTIQGQLNSRAHEIAKERIADDRAALNNRPDGVPLNLLPLDTDSGFKATEKDFRVEKANPKPNTATLTDLTDRLNKRAVGLAKDLRRRNRGFLDSEPEGVSIDDVPLDEDETFKAVEVDRLRALASSAPNKKDISDLEKKLNDRAHELAAGTKETGRAFLKPQSHGIPRDLINLDGDKDFVKGEKELRRLRKSKDRNAPVSADQLEDNLQLRADEVALQQLKGGRDQYLDVQPEGVDLTDVPLDTDPTFTQLELDRALAVARGDNAESVKETEAKLNDRAHELAKGIVQSDRSFLPKEINNIPVEELPLDTDDRFLKLERQRRQHVRARKMDAVGNDEERLKQRATELAQDVIGQDLAPLKDRYRGIPTAELNLHADEKFRELAGKRRRKRGQGRVKAIDMVAIEDEMDKRACEIADDLVNEERAFLDAEPEGMYLHDVPLDDDAAFVQLEGEYHRRSKDPRLAKMNKDVLRELCNEMNQRSHAIAREEFMKMRDFLDPEPEGVPLLELGLDEDPEFKEAEIARYKNNKNEQPSPHVNAEMEERMKKRAEELARQLLANDRAFLDPEPEGVPLSELPLDADQQFSDLARERRRRKKNLQRGVGEEQVKALESKMNERSHEMAKNFLTTERAFLDPEPEGVPLAALPLNMDISFRALEKERLKIKGDPTKVSNVEGIESTLNDKAKGIARDLLKKERAFLDKEPMGVPLEDLPLNHDSVLNPIERKRREYRKEPKRYNDEIRRCEDQMADRVNEIASDFIEKERAFMDPEPEGVPLRYLPLSGDKDFRELERQRRTLVQNPTANKKQLTQTETKMNERAHALAKDLVEKGRGFLDPEPLGVPIMDVPLNGDEQFRKMEEQRRSIKQDPRNAATVKALEEKLNDRAYELTESLLQSERAFMDQQPLGLPLSELPLNQDLRMREIERTRRGLKKDNANGQHNADIQVLEEGMNARALQLAKSALEEERGFLDPEPCGVPLCDLPLDTDSEFHSKELQRLKLRKTNKSSEKIRALEADLNDRAKELAAEFIRKERAYLDQEPEGIPLEKLALDKDPVFHSMEIERRRMVRNGENPSKVVDLEKQLNARVHELALDIRGWQDTDFFDNNKHVAPNWPRIGELYPEGRYEPIVPDEASTADVLSSPEDVGYLAPFIAALSRYPVLLKRLLVNEAHPVNAPYTFLFFDPNSNPVYIDVDDRVPCNSNKEPMFIQSPNRYWYPLLLEKAYAKFVGGYERMDNCTPHETLRDLTGRPVTHAPFDAKLAEAANIGDVNSVAFWRGIADDMSRGDIVLCMSNSNPRDMDGIHAQCSYAVLGIVETIEGSNNAADTIVKLHNPYSQYEPFYNGPLSADDPNWTDDLRRACRYDADRQDVLYLPLPTFLKNFSSLQRCHINCGDRLTASGAWDQNTAGGNPKFTTFRNNPIYLIENKGTRPTTILAEVRHSSPMFVDPDGLNHYPQTGIALMQPLSSTLPATPLVTNSTHKFLQKGMMLDSREVCSIMEIPASTTCYLIPYTMKAGQLGSFNVSIYPGMAKVTLVPLHFAGLSREPTTTHVTLSPGEDGTRVDFMITDATTVHILLRQDKVTDQKSVRKGDAIAEDDVIITLFNEQSVRCATSGQATNAREHSLAFKSPQAGRYSLLLTSPNKPVTGSCPCTVSIYTPKMVTAKFVPPPAGARPLQQTRFPTVKTKSTAAATRNRRASSATGRSRTVTESNASSPPLPPIKGAARRTQSEMATRKSMNKVNNSARY